MRAEEIEVGKAPFGNTLAVAMLGESPVMPISKHSIKHRIAASLYSQLTLADYGRPSVP
jgi:hypothetical protein